MSDPPSVPARQMRAWLEARLLVRTYYTGLLYFAFTDAPGWADLAMTGDTGLLWPVAWAHATGIPMAAAIVATL
ncbi:MAG: hypothetical protein WCL04_04925, partial [Verrucomicrobiota bacterium]